MKTRSIFIKILIVLPALILLNILVSCTKEFLDAKPNTNLVIPQTLDDLFKLLDNTNDLNFTGGLGHMGADEYVFVDYATWKGTLYSTERNSYIWADDIYEGETPVIDWDIPYLSIYYANNVLQSLETLNLPASSYRDHVKGWALFTRAYAYHDLIRNFCLAFDPNTADVNLGLPLRLTPNIDKTQPRSTLRQTYDLVLDDLKQASALLTSQFQETNRNRPSKATSYALLARVYISMNLFEEAERYADLSLELHNKLIDYNTISITAAFPFSENNVETLFRARGYTKYTITSNAAFNTAITVDPEVINSYTENDLRLSIFFAKNLQGNYYVKAGYYGAGNQPYHGPAVDELYLIKAECLARRAEVTDAMSWLNNLLIKRYKNTTPYIPLATNNKEDAINIVLKERKKELVWRGIRWSDIKRLNKLGANIILRRELNGEEYILLPNSPRYAFPIPDDEITRSKIQQNPR